MKPKKRKSRRAEFKVTRRTQPGSSPGQIIPHPHAQRPQMRVMGYGPDECHERELKDVEHIRAFLGDHAVTWLDIEGLGDAAMIQNLGRIFNLHRLALEDVVNHHQRAKVEEYEDVLFIVLRMVTDGERCGTEQISIFVGPNWLITLQEGQPGDPFNYVRKRIRDGIGRMRTAGSDYLAYALIDAVIDAYFPAVETYAEKLDELEETCIRGRNGGVIDKLHTVKTDMLVLRRAVWPMRETLAEMMRETTPRITATTRVYLRDCYDHVIQLIDLLETYRELTADLRDLYMSTISNRINETMRVLTIISTLFIPLTFIAGIYGMNFDPDSSPWNMPELRWYFGYPACLALMGLTTLGLIVFFVRKGWIGQRFFGASEVEEEETPPAK